jgi:tetratricopeptide (TPR) repeat protein
MLTPQVEVSSGVYREQMGLGMFLLQRADKQGSESLYFEHTGVNAGFLTYFLGSVTGGNGVVIMMNNDSGAGELGKELRRAVARVYGWPDFLPDAIQPASVSATALDACAGRYQRGPDDVLTFRREGNYLIETVNAGAPILASPVGADTVAFTDYTMRGTFVRDAAGHVTGFRMLGSEQLMPRLAPDKLLPNELLRLGRVPEAVASYRQLKLGESQLTYMAYELLNRRPADLPGAEGLLTLALEQFPQSAMVHARLGELHLRRGDTARAITAYQTVLRLNPEDKEVREKLQQLAR